MKSQIRRSSEKWRFLRGEKFPTTSYEITKVTENTAGDYNTLLEEILRLKASQNQFSLKANVTVADGNVSIASEPTDINREDFGLKFELPLENGLLNKEINLQIFGKSFRKQVIFKNQVKEPSKNRNS